MLLDCDTGPGRAGCSESTRRRVMRKQRHGGRDIHGQGETCSGAQQMTTGRCQYFQPGGTTDSYSGHFFNTG